MADLGNILESIDVAKEQSPVAGLVYVDLSAYGSKEPLVWHKPSILEVYRIAKDSEELYKENRHWEESMAMDIATLAACHTAPMSPTGNIGQFYAKIANSENHQDLYFYLLNRMRMEFPFLQGTSKDQLLIVRLCAQYYRKHPEECGHMPGHILDELKRIYESDTANSKVL